jgi:hypothetical protein
MPRYAPQISPVDLVDGRVSSVHCSDADVVSLVTHCHDPWANMVIAITGSVDGMAAFLTDDEVPFLGILSILSMLWTLVPLRMDSSSSDISILKSQKSHFVRINSNANN